MKAWEDRLKRTVEQTAPSEDQTERIWNEIAAQAKTNRFGWKPALRVAVAMMSVICICTLAGVGVNAATDGALFKKMREIFGWTEEKEQMVADVLVFHASFRNTPSLVSATEEHIVFANERCMAIYSREKECLIDTVDLQEIGCVYFAEDYREEEFPLTRIFQDGQKIYIFNKFKRVSTEQVYCYDMELMGQERPISLIDNQEEIQKITNKSEQHFETNVKETYSYMPTMGFWNVDTWHTYKFSEKCLTWENADGEQFISCIVIDGEERYFLQTYPADLKGEAIRTEIKMEVVIAQEEKLPEFVYEGDDKVMKALVEYTIAQKKRYDMLEVEVTIPAPLIFKTMDEGEDKIVFAHLYNYSYIKNGVILYSGGLNGLGIGRVRLSFNEVGEYVVTEHLRAQDGNLLRRDVEAMCAGYDVDAEAFLRHRDGEEIRREMLRMYVTNNQIDVKYYGDYSGGHSGSFYGRFYEELKEINEK